MNGHVSDDTLTKWRGGGGLNAEAVIAVAAHLAACPACTARARESVRIAQAADAIREQLEGPNGQNEDEEHPARQRAHAAPPSFHASSRKRTRLLAALAAAAVFTFALLGLLWPRGPITSPPVPRATPTLRTAALPAGTNNPDEWSTLVQSARAGTAVPMPAVLRDLRSDIEILRGESDPFGGVTPSGVVLETTRPRFVWRLDAPSTTPLATVVIYEGEREVMRSRSPLRPPWTPGRDLERGVTYTWEVEIENEGRLRILPAPPAPPARFHILSESLVSELARVRATGDPLRIGLVCARAGLVAEARAELRKVTAPADLAAAHNALRAIDHWR